LLHLGGQNMNESFCAAVLNRDFHLSLTVNFHPYEIVNVEGLDVFFSELSFDFSVKLELTTWESFLVLSELFFPDAGDGCKGVFQIFLSALNLIVSSFSLHCPFEF
jgi:hypothetical protein